MYTEEQYILEIGQALADDHAAVMVGAGFSKNAEKIRLPVVNFEFGTTFRICFMRNCMVTVSIRVKITVVPCAGGRSRDYGWTARTRKNIKAGSSG